MKRLLAQCFVVLLVGSFGSIKAVGAKPITFAYQTPTLSSTLPLIVGAEFGFFSAERLELRTVFVRGGPTAIEALIGGDVDYTLASGVTTVRAIAQGAPLVIVGGIQPYVDYTLIGANRLVTKALGPSR